jgi:hypothetical protein
MKVRTLHGETMNQFINHNEASEFMNSIKDPFVKELVRYSYQIVCTIDAAPQGSFDLEYFCKVMERFLCNRETISKALLGQYEDDPTGWGR